MLNPSGGNLRPDNTLHRRTWICNVQVRDRGPSPAPTSSITGRSLRGTAGFPLVEDQQRPVRVDGSVDERGSLLAAVINIRRQLPAEPFEAERFEMS